MYSDDAIHYGELTMVGFRKESYYVAQFGETLGKQKYQKVVKNRESRQYRKNTGDSTVPGNVVECQLCKKSFKRITSTHLKTSCVETITMQAYIKRFPNATLICDNIKKLCSTTKESTIAKYGLEIGSRKWDEYVSLQAITNSYEYKAEKYNFSKKQFDEYNNSRSVTKHNMVSKYGTEIGLEKWNSYCERQRYTNSIEYFIEKYGEMDGIIKWNAYCDDRAKSRTIEFIMKKYSVDILGAESILSERFANNNGNSSEGERVFIQFIKSFLDEITNTYENKQFCIWSDKLAAPVFFDVTSSNRKKIIEYNGDYWHGNQSMYEDTFIIKQTGRTVLETRQRDEMKYQAAITRGFDLFIVWENEFIDNPENIKQQLLKWWNNE